MGGSRGGAAAAAAAPSVTAVAVASAAAAAAAAAAADAELHAPMLDNGGGTTAGAPVPVRRLSGLGSQFDSASSANLGGSGAASLAPTTFASTTFAPTTMSFLQQGSDDERPVAPASLPRQARMASEEDRGRACRGGQICPEGLHDEWGPRRAAHPITTLSGSVPAKKFWEVLIALCPPGGASVLVSKDR